NGPSFKKWIREHRERGQEALSLAHEHLQELADLPAPVLPVFIQQDARKAEFFLRMLFSTLVDADFLDTEAHFSPDRSALRGNSIPIAELWEHFHENQRQLQEQSP